MKTKKYIGIVIFFIALLFLLSYNVNAETDYSIKTNLYLDYPNTSIINQDTLYIDGWVMSTYANKTIEIYIDGNLQQTNIETRARADVHSAIKGYGTLAENPEPGFKTTLNLKNFKDGNHKLEVRVVSDKKTTLQSITKNITLKKYPSTLYLDYPNTSSINQDTLYIDGWVMSTYANKTIEIYIDGNLQEANIETRARADVHSAIKGYGTLTENPKPGFKTTLNLKNISDGKHTLEVKSISDTGEVLASEKKEFTLKKYNTYLNIDYPNTTQINADSMEINGWVMSTYKNKSIEIYVDGKLQEANILTRARGDVHSVIKGYGTITENPEPGFKTTLSLKNITDGKHTLEIKSVSDTKQILSSYKKDFTLKKYNTYLNIDYPNTNQIREDTMEVNGWVMSTCENKSIEIYIDGKLQQTNIATRARGDVHSVIKGYGNLQQNPEPGIKAILNLENISDGNHTLKINTISNDSGEILATYTKQFNLFKYPTTLYIDRPISDFVTGKKQLEVSGWVMSGYANAKIQIYVNGILQKSEISRRARGDVQSAITGYGSKEKNPTPGFSTMLDISNYKEGIYTIKVNIVTNDGTVLGTASTKFEIDRSILVGIDVSQHNGTIDWAKVKDQIDFAIIRCGYGEDNTAQDDTMYYRNITECEKYGIPYGVYIYSYAIDLNKAKSEVNHVIRLLRGKKPAYGIWFDMEDADGYKSRYNVSDQMCRDITYTFCSTMKNQGYNVGFYANLNWLTGILDDARLDQFPKWVAQWNTSCDYKKDYVMWQYTSSGTVDGITGRVDMDYYYR